MSKIFEVSDETQAMLAELKEEFGVYTSAEVLREALKRAKRTADGFSITLKGGDAPSTKLKVNDPTSTPAPQSALPAAPTRQQE